MPQILDRRNQPDVDIALLQLVRGPIARIPVKISWIADLKSMGRDPSLGRLCAKDARGGGGWVPLGFLASYMQHSHSEARTALVPVHLMHPELDQWTPAELARALCEPCKAPPPANYCVVAATSPSKSPGCRIS